MTDRMLAEVADGIGWLTFNHPERRNAISLEMAQAGADIIDRFEADPDVRVIVLKGNGKAWVSGADIGEQEKPPENTDPRQRPGLAFYEGVRACRKPVVAMIHGYCMGGGVALACACDLRIVADDAVFAIPAGRLGIAYRPQFVEWVVETVGVPATKEILFTARRYNAAEALRIGLANRLVAAAELEAFTRDYAGGIAGNAPLSVHANKGIISEIAKGPAARDLARCEELAAICARSEDLAEGRRAFLEKRQPVFRGR
ncbi:MAG TPA: enoyl-CoA hydratase [Xanthobacteraceae bacterium]|nr:enoyl-CoA hydratase [Xanthobacteraceae bacterium]